MHMSEEERTARGGRHGRPGGENRGGDLLEELAKMLNTRLLCFVPRDNIVQHAELQRKTVIEFAPDSAQAENYRRLAALLDGNTGFTVPTPLTNEELEALLLRFCPV